MELISNEEKLVRESMDYRRKWLMEKEFNKQLRIEIRKLIQHNVRICPKCSKEYDLNTLKFSCGECGSNVPPSSYETIQEQGEKGI